MHACVRVGNNPTSCAAGRAVLEVMEEEDTLGNCWRMGQLFTSRLGDLCERMPQVLKEVR